MTALGCGVTGTPGGSDPMLERTVLGRDAEPTRVRRRHRRRGADNSDALSPGMRKTLGMPGPPVSDEIGGALGRFFHGGAGPSHSRLTSAFAAAGYGADDPYRVADGTPNKETRVHIVVRAATRRSARARDLVDGILTSLRLSGMFDVERETYDRQAVTTLQRALRREGWDVTDDGLLTTLGEIDLETGGREALDEQFDRLRRSTEDPGALLGSAKDLLEAVAKFVLEELGTGVSDGDFGQLWFLARDRLGIHPKQVVPDGPAADEIRKVLGASWTIAEQANSIRNLQGAGHGHTLPTGVTPEMALLVVREACSVAAFTMATLDRVLGR